MSKFKRIASLLSLLFSSSLVIFTFQNCAPSPQAGSEILASQLNYVCTGSQCVTSHSYVDTSVNPADGSTHKTSYINIVSITSKEECENSVEEVYNKQINCNVGGGCGLSCGKPSVHCLSANPNHYGACLTQDELNAAPNANNDGVGIPADSFKNKSAKLVSGRF